MQIVIWGADENTVVVNIPLLNVPIDPASMEQVNEAVATAEAAKDSAVEAAAQADAAADAAGDSVTQFGRGRPRMRDFTPLAFGTDESVVMSAGPDRRVNAELSDDSAGLLGLVKQPGRQALRGTSPVMLDEDGGKWAGLADGRLDAVLSDEATEYIGLLTQPGRLPLRNAPAFVRRDGGVFGVWNGERLDASVAVTALSAASGSAGRWYLNTTAVLGIVGYGQSWMVSNGNNGSLDEFEVAVQVARVMTISDGRGVSGWNGITPTVEAVTAMTDGREQITQWQSIVGPMAHRHSYLAQRTGGDATVFTRSEARAGYSLAKLAPPDFSWYDSSITDRPYLNWLRAVQGFNDMATAQGQPFELAVIPFIQGQADKATPYATYKAHLIELTERMQADAMAITGQLRKPQILIYQCPSDMTDGQWELLQAQVDLCHERDDYTLCGAGWAEEQHDQTHFVSERCVCIGECYDIGFDAYLRGVPYSAPYIKRVVRTGTSIRFEIGGDYPVRNETGIVTKRFYLSDLTTPVPFFGFEYSGATITAATLDADGWGGTITLNADAPGRLWFAGHNGSRKLSPSDPDANESTNRATLIADVEIPAVYATERLTLGLASGFWDI
ncbi:hypothetical protein ACHFJ0_05115 [Paracoccus sp. NGMCC 1.201697]|uniref:Sialate O-acetylesterase domain-containing protein n=1 Tax=Paracoccus broussonetiae subsp. drimophilus TaxID=3373869 RepID=A0ABW7LHF8_9RHOB